MRALLVMMLVAGAAAADGPRATAIGFDHYVHDQKLFTNTQEPVPCARCHVERAGRLVGRPDHATCFGACHGALPVAPRRGAKIVEPDRMKVCTNCHAEAALVAPFTGKLAVAYPPYKLDPDFGITLGHKQHAAVACAQCHAEPDTNQRGVPHARCAGCHDGATGHGPPMSTCTGCHPAASGSPVPPELAAVHNTVTSAFSHRKHAARGGKDCAACHDAIRKTDDTELPRPTIADCASCHDGKRAFATTEACTRCHPAEPPDKFDVARPTARFVHGGSHKHALDTTPCAGCHPITQGEVVVAGHAACATCHARDFGARAPKICGACHSATEPWRHLVPDRAPAETTEFGATLDHGKHGGACTSCHALRTQTAQLRMPRGHAACTTKGCHAVTGGPAPQLGACVACHQQGLAAARTTKREGVAWSVRKTFDHEKHRDQGGALACSACHTSLAGPSVLELPAPTKVTCAPCHDGKAAFKLTGTECKRCHL